jgi:hypothetical protein
MGAPACSCVQVMRDGSARHSREVLKRPLPHRGFGPRGSGSRDRLATPPPSSMRRRNGPTGWRSAAPPDPHLGHRANGGPASKPETGARRAARVRATRRLADRPCRATVEASSHGQSGGCLSQRGRRCPRQRANPGFAADRQTDRLLRAAAATSGAERERLLNEVVIRTMPVAEAIAARYRARGESQEDLVQVAALALVKATRRYEPERGTHFLAYAVPTISGELCRHFRDHGWDVRHRAGCRSCGSAFGRRRPSSAGIGTGAHVGGDLGQDRCRGSGDPGDVAGGRQLFHSVAGHRARCEPPWRGGSGTTTTPSRMSSTGSPSGPARRPARTRAADPDAALLRRLEPSSGSPSRSASPRCRSRA